MCIKRSHNIYYRKELRLKQQYTMEWKPFQMSRYVYDDGNNERNHNICSA